MAALEFPVDPEVVVTQVIAGDPATVGERVAGFVLEIWEQPEVLERLLALLRAAATTEQVALLMRGFAGRDWCAGLPPNWTSSSRSCGLS